MHHDGIFSGEYVAVKVSTTICCNPTTYIQCMETFTCIAFHQCFHPPLGVLHDIPALKATVFHLPLLWA